MLKSKSVSRSFGTGGKAFIWFSGCFLFVVSHMLQKVINYILIGQKIKNNAAAGWPFCIEGSIGLEICLILYMLSSM